MMVLTTGFVLICRGVVCGCVMFVLFNGVFGCMVRLVLTVVIGNTGERVDGAFAIFRFEIKNKL